MYSYCYVRSVLGILFHCVVLCIVCCKCILYYCHSVSTQLQLTNISYHYHIISRQSRSSLRCAILRQYNSPKFRFSPNRLYGVITQNIINPHYCEQPR